MINKEDLTLEQAIKRVEDIVNMLEDDSIELPLLMKKYDEGIELIKFCRSELTKAEEKVKVIRLKDNDIAFEDFNNGK